VKRLDGWEVCVLGHYLSKTKVPERVKNWPPPNLGFNIHYQLVPHTKYTNGVLGAKKSSG